jgi:uncharacterized protein (TIGR03382 family)
MKTKLLFIAGALLAIAAPALADPPVGPPLPPATPPPPPPTTPPPPPGRPFLVDMQTGDVWGILVPRYDAAGNLIGYKYATSGWCGLSHDALHEALGGCRLNRVLGPGSNVADAQYWFTPRANLLGLDPVTDLGFPPGKGGTLNAYCTGRLKPDAPFITRPYALGNGRVSGSLAEVVCAAGAVQLETFHTGPFGTRPIAGMEGDCSSYCGPGRRLAHGKPAPPIYGTPQRPPARPAPTAPRPGGGPPGLARPAGCAAAIIILSNDNLMDGVQTSGNYFRNDVWGQDSVAMQCDDWVGQNVNPFMDRVANNCVIDSVMDPIECGFNCLRWKWDNGLKWTGGFNKGNGKGCWSFDYDRQPLPWDRPADLGPRRGADPCSGGNQQRVDPPFAGDQSTEEAGGCGCSGGDDAAPGAMLLLLAIAWARRRCARPRC